MASPNMKSAELGQCLEEDFKFHNNVASMDKRIRLGFLRKVYGILASQLLFTIAVCGIMYQFRKSILLFTMHQSWILPVLFIANIGIFVCMYVKRTHYPANLLFLYIFTLLESFLVGFVVMTHQLSVVLQALGLTSVIVFGLTLYTFQSKKDFSSWHAALMGGLMILFFGGLINLFIGSTMLEFGLSVGGALLFSLLIIFDTAMIMTRVSPEEYVTACIDLYLDIINLFLYIIRILDAMKQG